MLIDEFKSHTRGQSLHHVAALGKEAALELFLRFAAYLALRSGVHVFSVEIALAFGFAIDGQHARKQAVPLAKEVCRHLVVVEEVAVVAAIATVRHVEIQHPARVGPQLVVARIERIFQHELAAGVSSSAHDDALPLHHKAVGREQFHIEHLAHIGRLEIVGAEHVGLVPERIAHEIAGVVGVDIHFFLHLGVFFQCFAQRVETVGENWQKSHRQQEKYRKKSFHTFIFLHSTCKFSENC